jgi:exopolysaccharide biosynthesis predicted pyruvyltransferase EpsI
MLSKKSRPPDRVDLEGLLAEFQREPQPILFIPNPGNAGDALIAHATRQLFDRLGLDYLWVNDYRRLDPRERVVVYGGGGNLVPLYHDASRALRWAAGRAKRVLVLPHTISGHEELLADLGPETDLICRELVSYDYVRGVARSARCHLADDLVFLIDANATLAPPRPDACLAALRSAAALSDDPLAVATQVRGLAPEAPSKRAVVRLSSCGAGARRGANVCHTGALHLLRYLDLFDEVRTNRMHLAIGAAVLGKRVKFHSNSYFKNRAVYEFSMRGRFPDVEWVEAA